MDFETFTKNAVKTESVVKPEDRPISMYMVRLVIKLAVKSAQLTDVLKKGFFYNKNYQVDDIQRLVEEIREISVDISNSFDNDFGGSEETGGNPFSGHDTLTFNTRIMHALLGYFTESGEMLEFLDEALRLPETVCPDYINLREEVGDVDWYKAILFDTMRECFPDVNFNEGKIRSMIIDKLKARYGEKFSESATNNRDLTVERSILESKL
jgi:hypothetical protein